MEEGAITYDLDARHRGVGDPRVSILPPHVVHDGRPATADGYRKRVLYLDADALDASLIGPAVDRPDVADPRSVLEVRRLDRLLHPRDGAGGGGSAPVVVLPAPRPPRRPHRRDPRSPTRRGGRRPPGPARRASPGGDHARRGRDHPPRLPGSPGALLHPDVRHRPASIPAGRRIQEARTDSSTVSPRPWSRRRSASTTRPISPGTSEGTWGPPRAATRRARRHDEPGRAGWLGPPIRSGRSTVESGDGPGGSIQDVRRDDPPQPAVALPAAPLLVLQSDPWKRSCRDRRSEVSCPIENRVPVARCRGAAPSIAVGRTGSRPRGAGSERPSPGCESSMTTTSASKEVRGG